MAISCEVDGSDVERGKGISGGCPRMSATFKYRSAWKEVGREGGREKAEKIEAAPMESMRQSCVAAQQLPVAGYRERLFLNVSCRLD